MNKGNQLKAGALLSYVNLAIGTIIPFLYTPIMLKILGQAEYGLYSLANSVISYLSLLTLGMGGAIGRYYMKQLTKNDKEMMEKTAGLFLVIYLFIALVSLIVGSSITCFTGTLFGKGLSSGEISKLNILIVIMTVSAVISLIMAPFGTIVTCHERYVFQKVLAICCTISVPLLNLIALYAGFASIGLASSGIIFQIFSAVVTIWYCHRKICIRPQFRDLPWGMLKEIVSFSIFIFIGMIADMLYWATDKVLIGALIGSVSVAVYNIGVTFNTMLHQISSAISNLFTPRVNRMVFSARPLSEISDFLIRVGRLQYLVVSLVVSGFIAFGQDFILLWAGDGYKNAYYVALLTMIPTVIPLIENIAYNTIVAQNNHRFRSILYVILAIANAVSTFYILPVMGIIGAALCTFIVYILGQGITMNWFYYKKVGLDIPAFWKNIFQMTFVPAGMLILFFFLQHYGMTVDSLSSFLAGVVIYTVIFCLLSWLFTMNRYEKDLVLGLFRKVLPIRQK